MPAAQDEAGGADLGHGVHPVESKGRDVNRHPSVLVITGIRQGSEGIAVPGTAAGPPAARGDRL
ncbi:hypothetical protein GCM10009544_54020 [Streptomyces stramineus]|uniref:Uncharacterized protein n=1 Tax=Streptomyces stramineus TaxID=173861 RepID=A0ABN1AX68_9ACTN